MNLKNSLFAGLILATLSIGCSDDDAELPAPNTGVVGVSVSASDINEDAGSVTVTFSTNTTFDTNLSIAFTTSGSASAGADYEAFSGNATIVAGESAVSGTLIINDDSDVEDDEEIIITITSVTGDTNATASETPVTITIRDNDSFPLENGILVLHEGNFFGGNASVSFVTEDLTTVTNGVFIKANAGPLGDVAQSIAFNDGLAYIVVNNSQKIEVVNRFNFESVATIDSGLLNPRYMVFANGKGYVTNWGDGTVADDDYVAVINLDDHTVESTIAVEEGPEEILANGDMLYVAHRGGFSQNNIVSVIDVATNAIETVTVGDVPDTMQFDANGNLWVLCAGVPSFTGNETAGSLVIVDISNNTVSNTFNFGLTEHPEHLSVNGSTLYYYLAGEVFAMEMDATDLPSSPVISGVSFYDMAINEGLLYGTDAKDFASNGSLEIYNLTTNSLVDSKEVSIVPSEVYFNGDF